ncbi:FecCD family ABC transporter permease [Amnibacterium endophyticum]|uniref:FecCD family ABC transporter permease n=1 Tax=Amnibacterium endophyticum TaxID=2109337 RepID=A0ABW4LJG5_9MICO
MTAIVSAPAVGRRARIRRRRAAVLVLAGLVAVMFAVALMVGDTVYSPAEVVRVVLGQTVPGASFTVGELRLPRAVEGVLTGAAFGLGGVAFQTMLRNPLAAPDVIGISSGASAAAVLGIVVLGLDAGATSLLAVAAALVVAGAILLLSYRGGIADTRLILIGIGVAAMLESVVAAVLLRAANTDLQVVMRWLTGSLNNASWEQLTPVALALLVAAPVLGVQSRGLGLLRLGDDGAAALGVRVQRVRILSVVAAVGLVAFATAAAGPIAFVAFLAGPIAARVVGPGASLLLPSALTGALLVLVADFAGETLLGTRYPVGVVTGALGAPFLLWLLVRTNRAGGAL